MMSLPPTTPYTATYPFSRPAGGSIPATSPAMPSTTAPPQRLDNTSPCLSLPALPPTLSLFPTSCPTSIMSPTAQPATQPISPWTGGTMPYGAMVGNAPWPTSPSNTDSNNNNSPSFINQHPLAMQELSEGARHLITEKTPEVFSEVAPILSQAGRIWISSQFPRLATMASTPLQPTPQPQPVIPAPFPSVPAASPNASMPQPVPYPSGNSPDAKALEEKIAQEVAKDGLKLLA